MPPTAIVNRPGSTIRRPSPPDEREGPLVEGEAHDARLPRPERDPLEALEGATRHGPRGLGVGHVELDDLVRRHRAGVPHLDRHRNRRAHRGRLRHGELRVGEARVAEAVAERVEGLAVEVAVGPLRHRVVVEGRELVERAVEREGQAAGRAHVAEEDVGHRGARGLAGVPRLDDRGDVPVGPADRERAAVQQDEDDRLARGRGHHLLQERLLHLRQVEARPVAAREALDPHRHLLALEAGGEAEHQHDRVRRPRRGHRLRHLVAPTARRLPQELGDGVVLLVLELEPDRVGLARPQRHATGDRHRLVVGAALGDRLAVQDEPALRRAAHAERVAAGGRSRDPPGPANAEGVVVERGVRGPVGPVEVDRRVHAREDGRAVEVAAVVRGREPRPAFGAGAVDERRVPARPAGRGGRWRAARRGRRSPSSPAPPRPGSRPGR